MKYPKLSFVSRMRLWCCVTLAVLSLPTQAAAGEMALGVKAAFLYNFTKFIEWPASAAPGSGDTFQLCVAGSLLDTDAISQVLEGKTTQGKTLKVRFVSQHSELPGCHMLYSTGEKPYWSDEWLAQSVHLPVVTVGEGEDFVEKGGVIGLVIVDGKVRFAINEAKASGQDIVISSKLLLLARRVVR